MVTGTTGFEVFPEEDIFSEADEAAVYDHIEVDYLEKLRVQRERVSHILLLDGKTGAVLP